MPKVLLKHFILSHTNLSCVQYRLQDCGTSHRLATPFPSPLKNHMNYRYKIVVNLNDQLYSFYLMWPSFNIEYHLLISPKFSTQHSAKIFYSFTPLKDFISKQLHHSYNLSLCLCHYCLFREENKKKTKTSTLLSLRSSQQTRTLIFN